MTSTIDSALPSLIFMKSKPDSETVSESEIENETENLIDFRPCIAAPNNLVSGIESGSRLELKFVQLYLAGTP
jgi:hypothetical protein